ncbi:hypothetical protein FH972_024571 [Carpinus fangiana]|uniref:Uncharacterized protein n=1 Tax=Carpinus fangiana TaxID=176857 RepID=A0A5N6KZA8_9ROSI|nr:hypothetical protein FH972_024571 [Carpinus fangiana]
MSSGPNSPQAPVLIPTASLHNRVALITGASRGIGAGVALELARRGASVVVNYATSAAPAEEVCARIHALGNGARAIAVQADVSSVAEIERLFQAAKQAFGHIDIVMSNSGTESWDATGDVDEAKFDRIFGLNARAQFFVGQAALRHCSGPAPRLVLMSSIAAGLLGVRDHALYNSSKMAVIGMVKSFATDFASSVPGMTVNGIAPGGVKSDMFTQNAWRYIPGGQPDWGKEKIEGLMASHCPLGRCAEPEDVARVRLGAQERGGGVGAADFEARGVGVVLRCGAHVVEEAGEEEERTLVGGVRRGGVRGGGALGEPGGVEVDAEAVVEDGGGEGGAGEGEGAEAGGVAGGEVEGCC